MALGGRRSQPSFGAKVLGGLSSAAAAVGTAKTLWDGARYAYQLGATAAPLLGALL